MNLYFDLETIPAPEALRKVVVEAERKKKRNEGIADDDEALYRASAVSGDFGRIFCIGYALDEGETQIISGEESQIISKWWEVAKNVNCFIGHNILDFDIPFLYKRSIVLKCRPSQLVPVKKFQTDNVFDTQKEWSRWDYQGGISLHNLSIALNLPSSKDGGIDGSQVYDFYLANKHNEIYEYCKRDVELTRKVYRRMRFLD